VVLVRASETKGEYLLEQEPSCRRAHLGRPGNTVTCWRDSAVHFEKSEFQPRLPGLPAARVAFQAVIYSAAIEQRAFTRLDHPARQPMAADDESTLARTGPNISRETFRRSERKALDPRRYTPGLGASSRMVER